MKHNYLQIKKSMACIMAGLLFVLCANAQIGYQISLLNTATGEPRANETVNVTATITDSSGGVVWTGTQSVTSNDFGVLSLTVGNADTFTTLDLQEHRLPFFIEVSANGAMIGKSQILSVPVAEVAKRVEPLKLEDLIVTCDSIPYYELDQYPETFYLTFNTDYTVTWKTKCAYNINNIFDHWVEKTYGTFKFYIDGSNVYYYGYGDDHYWCFRHVVYLDGQLGTIHESYKKQ